MNNNMMINPANYYNPFAKYNYVSKTRGVYYPKNDQSLSEPVIEKSTSIYSDNYNAEADVLACMNDESIQIADNSLFNKITKFFNK